ncbi:putative signal peptide-containing protein [Cryptosporidium canis]|uniref:Signal peptide-containing protein n=1 Tax=Cryptosporidium canis TaxID=195482 RepID=A0ABQ8PAS5_9CRYT|nr:putative signal peptide-containing protein [Cryptosporidium canis]
MQYENTKRRNYLYGWALFGLLVRLHILLKLTEANVDGFGGQQSPDEQPRALVDVLRGSNGQSPALYGDYTSSINSINGIGGYPSQYYSDGSFIGLPKSLIPSTIPGVEGFDNMPQSYTGITEKGGYLEDPFKSVSQRESGTNTYDIVYSNGPERSVPLFLSRSPLVVGGGGYSRPNYSSINRQEINKYFSPYSSIHYLSSVDTPNNGDSKWTWNHIEKPILRTNTVRPVEFKHKVPNMDEAWWNASYNVRKEPRQQSGVSADSVQTDVSGEKSQILESNSTAGQEHEARVQSESQHDHHHGHHHHHHKSSKHVDGRKHQGGEKDHNVEDEVLRSTTVGDVVNLTRLEVPNPYDRRVAIDRLISTSLDNLKQENWSVPVEEIINATFIYPGTQQPDLVPNQMGPKVKPQDFYCNPQIHKCTNLQSVGTAIGEPVWKIYNTSTLGRAQRRVGNLLDDTEHLTMGLTPTFIDYIEQEPTIELLESIAKAPTDIFQIPENGSISQFYDNATRLGVFQASEFINPLPQNRTDQKFANALKKAAIDCLLSNFTLPNCNIPQNNSQNEQIYGNRSIYQLFKDPADPRPY